MVEALFIVLGVVVVLGVLAAALGIQGPMRGRSDVRDMSVYGGIAGILHARGADDSGGAADAGGTGDWGGTGDAGGDGGF